MLVSFLLASLLQICSVFGNERRVYQSIMRDYIKDIRPIRDGGEPVVVKFGISVLEIVGLNEETGHGVIRGWLKMSWTDDYLQWGEKKSEAGVQKLEIPADKIWLPDVQLYNGITEMEQTNPRVVVSSDGTVIMVTPAIFKLTCKHEFTGNSWTCPFKFGSWVYDGFKLDLAPYGKSDLDPVDIDMSDYVTSDSWMLLSHSGKREVKLYDCCTEPYVSMAYSLKLRSKVASFLGRRK